MRKTFLNVSLISLLAFAVPVSFTSCKDYDDDIQRVDTENKELSDQLATLQAAVDANKKAADAAALAAQAAQTAADKAAQEAALAQKAAADAKVEAINEAMSQVKELLKGVPTAEQLSKLSGQIEGIEKGLSTLKGTVDEHEKAISALKIQVAALEKFEEATGKDLSTIKGQISDLESKISSAMTKDDVDKVLKEANESVQKTVNASISTLQGVISNRLTSITLVPDTYIDGIETIEFVSLKYQPLKQVSTGMAANGSEVIVSTDENPAQYRLNPITAQLADIDEQNIEFVALQATARGVVESPIAYVKGSAKIADSGLEKGILTVQAKKNTTGSLNLGGDQIYTVALKVPIAESLLADKETPEYVYSEYARLHETTLTPKIAEISTTTGKFDCTKLAHKHYSDSLTIWKSNVDQEQLVTKKVVYNESLDLATLVTGCKNEDAAEITAEELAKYGLEFQYAVAQGVYNTGAQNKTDQQQFASIKGSTITSKLPNGETNNKAAIDKEPIVRISLVDTKNLKIADQRYLKIKWVEKEEVPVEPVDLGSKTLSVKYLGCNEVVTDGLDWKTFINDFYGKVQGAKPDMSKDEFTQIYLATDPKVETNYTRNGGDIVFDSNASADAAVVGWTLSLAEIGKIIDVNTTVVPHAWDYKNNKFTLKLTFEPTDKDYPVLYYTLNQTIEVEDAPAINGFYNNYWINPNSVYAVYPVQYKSQAQQKLVADNYTTEDGLTADKAMYHNNLMNGFSFVNSDYIVKNMTSCGSWDLQFCKDNQQAGYAPQTYGTAEPDMSTTANIAGYNLVKGLDKAAKLVWNPAHMAWLKNAAHAKEVYVDLTNNAAGKGLLDKTANVAVWSTINEYNVIPVHAYSIKFIKPINFKDNEFEGAFTDGIVNGSRVDWTKAFSLKDCFGYTVAKTTTNTTDEKEKWAADLYTYYGVSDPVWDTQDIRFGMKVSGNNIVVDDNVSPDNNTALTSAELKQYTAGGAIPSLAVQGNELVFTSNMGSQVAGAFNIFVKVSITHLWGEESAWVKIKVNPMSAR